MAIVSSADAQPSGPTYSFRIGMFEITNAEFAAFLNDTLAHLDDEKGAFVFHDYEEQKVVLHNAFAGEIGTNGVGTLAFDPTLSGAIQFVPSNGMVYSNGFYVVDPMFSDHPVTGVTWYGAVKFCNWLTLHHGLDASERAYSEGASISSWKPVTISSSAWQSRDLSVSERNALIDLLGYRLPMDDQAQTASAFSEWYKASAYLPTSGMNAVYGFGRNVLVGADANFLNSGHPLNNGTSSVGFFDGVNQLAGGGATAPNENGYGLFDVSGNVWEWMQDQAKIGQQTFPDFRSQRGGGWVTSAVNSLRTDQSVPVDPTHASNAWGFRVVQSMHRAMDVSPTTTDFNLSGPCGGPYSGSAISLSITSRTNALLNFEVFSDGPWLTIDQSTAIAGSFPITDATSDGLVDLEDYDVFASCMAGPQLSPQPLLPITSAHCLDVFDADDDGDVDLFDSNVLMRKAFSSDGVRLFDPQVEISPCSELMIGVNISTISIEIDALNFVEQKTVTLTVTEPMTVSPPDELTATGPVGGPFVPSKIVYQIDNASETPIRVEATADQPWVVLEWLDASSNALNVQNGTPIAIDTNGQLRVSIDESSASLDSGINTSSVAITNKITRTVVTRDVTVSVATSIVVVPPDMETILARCPSDYSPQVLLYEVENPSAVDLNMTVSTDQPTWFEIEPSSAMIASGGVIEVTVTPEFLAAPAVRLPGDYQATIQFAEASMPGVTIDRQISISVFDQLAVTPLSGFVSQGLVGGPFAPTESTFMLGNLGVVPTDFSITVDYDDSDPPWFSLESGGIETVCSNGLVCVNGTLPAIANFALPIELKILDNVETFPLGEYGATLRFQSDDDVDGCFFIDRRVELIVEDEPLLPEMVVVVGDDGGGTHPVHDFRIGLHEVSNAEFAKFLSNALRHPNDPRGQFMFFDGDTGSVYVNNSIAGTVGSNGFVGSGGFEAVMFDAAVGGWIDFDTTGYVVSNGLEDYPVVGVTWYGAAKFCNWLSVSLGIDPVSLVYSEGPSVTDWTPRFSRTAIASGATPAFRLPMDGDSQAAGIHNEWFKAGSLIDTNGVLAVYGFGRDVLSNDDANYLISGDPFEAENIGISPVGYYDGVNTVGGGAGAPTDTTSNAYGLLDMTGNVAEWVHGDTAPGRTRGGSWRNVGASTALRCDTSSVEPPGAVRDYVGFRLGQSLVSDALNISPALDIALDGFEGGLLTFVGGDFLDPADLTYSMSLSTNGTPRTYSVDVDVDWLWVNTNSSQSGLITPDAGTIDFGVSFNLLAFLLTSPVDEVAEWADVSVASLQPSGPAYSFRVSRFEVTNDQFATFLNAAIDNPSGAVGQYLLHDTDSGDVYLHDQQVGSNGVAGSGVLVFRASDAGRISYDASPGDYVVQAGFEQHPVAGVSWIGALKYCNYLTIAEGMSTGDRAYTEGSHAGDWHPVTISTMDWWGTADTDSNAISTVGARNLNTVERSNLVNNVRGFRLPMDGGADAADAFGEWYEAGAWDDSASVNRTYGFGRDDPIDAADANFDNQVGDTTSVGWYDGVNVTSGGMTTRDTANVNGLYDVSGNVREWMQDRALVGANQFRVRGGSFADTAGAIRNDASSVVMAADATDQFTGFRVVQGARDRVATITFTDQLLNTTIVRTARLFLRRALSWLPEDDFVSSGAWPGPYSPPEWITTITNRSSQMIQLTVASDQSWVSPDVTTTSLSAGGHFDLTASITASDQGPPPGEYQAILTMTNALNGVSLKRKVSLSVDEPLVVSPAGDLDIERFWGEPLVGVIDSFIVSNGIAQTIDFDAMDDVNWLDLGGQPSGSIGAGSAVNVDLLLNTQAEQLAGPANYASTVSISNTSAGSQIERTLNLKLKDPLEVVDSNGLIAMGNFGGPFAPIGGKTYILTNRAGIPIDWTATVDADWVSLNGGASAGGAISPGFSQMLTVDVNSNANTLPDGTYVATVSINNLSTPIAIEQTRSVALSVSEFLVVTPISDAEVVGPVGGTFSPLRFVYTVTNRDSISISWQASVAANGLLTVNGAATTGGVLTPSQSATVVVDVDGAQASQLSAGATSATIQFQNLSTGEGDTSRQVKIDALVPTNSVVMSSVDPVVEQPGGPLYPFEMSRFEISNAEFVKFLNDAKSRPNTARGAFMYHDIDSGDVFIHADSNGFVGTSGVGTHVFRSTTGGAITFDVASNAYEVASGMDSHPVVGVSWYGAVKYCNWLTLDAGLPPLERCYHESDSGDLNGWRPVTISAGDWGMRDLNDVERAQLVAVCDGYRLPMDDGLNNINKATDAADEYNEWYAAAAWRVIDAGAMICSNGMVGSVGFDCTTGGVGDPGFLCSGGVSGLGGQVGCNTLFGFGRDVADGRDANFATSGDPFDEGTTPVGFFDGATLLADGTTSTRANRNSSGIFDLSGNVQEWVQDKYSTPADRSVRGGAFISAPIQTPWINNDGRRKSNPHVATSSLIGFRVVRVDTSAAALGDADSDGDVDLDDYAILSICMTGPSPGALGAGCDAFDFDADANIDLVDFAQFMALYTGN